MDLVAPRAYPSHPLIFKLFMLIFIGSETKNVLDYQGQAGSTSVVHSGPFARSYSVSKKIPKIPAKVPPPTSNKNFTDELLQERREKVFQKGPLPRDSLDSGHLEDSRMPLDT